MEKWIYYSVLIVIVYVVWTSLYEYMVKKYTKCFCTILILYLIVGVLAFIFLLRHINNGCSHYKSITDIKNTPKIIFLFLIIMALCVIISNKLFVNGVSTGVNAGYIGSISNLYIIFVTIISSYLFNTKISNKNIFGIILMFGGAYLVSR